MTDQLIPEGFTKHVRASFQNITMNLYVKPRTDSASRFQAWDADRNEWVMVNGWLMDYEVLES